MLDKVKLDQLRTPKSSNLAQKDILDNHGKYPVYGASGFIKNVDFFHQNTEYIAVVKDGAGIGRTMFLPPKSSIIGTMQYLIPKNNVVPKYLYYAVKGMNLSRYYSGSTIPHIYFKDYKKELVPLYSNNKQEMISSSLEKLEEIVEKKQQQLSEYDKLIKSRFVEMFVDKYDMIKVSIKLRTTSGGTPKSSESEYYTNGTIPWLTSGEVNQGRIERTEKYITEKGLANSSAKWIPEKSIVIAMYGATAGKVGIIEMPTTTNQAVCAVLPHDEYNPEYLRFAFEYISDELAGKAVGGGQPNISQAIIKDSLIINPPLAIQKKFSTFVQQVDKLKFEDFGLLDKIRRVIINIEING